MISDLPKSSRHVPETVKAILTEALDAQGLQGALDVAAQSVLVAGTEQVDELLVGRAEGPPSQRTPERSGQGAITAR